MIYEKLEIVSEVEAERLSKNLSFDYLGKNVRVHMDEANNPWWVAQDVCDILEIKTEQTRRLDEDERGLRNTQTPQRSDPQLFYSCNQV